MQQHTFQLIETVAERTAGGITAGLWYCRDWIWRSRPGRRSRLPLDTVSVAIHREWHEAYPGRGFQYGRDRREHIAGHWDSRIVKISGRKAVSSFLETLRPMAAWRRTNFVNACLDRTLLAGGAIGCDARD